ncbi:MAG: polysaccharide biosynthesis C-terminal domain-containing protein [bacterium]
MLSFDRKRAFQNILISASIINIILSLILVPLFQHIGSAISVTVVEFFVTVTMLIYIQKTGVPIVRFPSIAIDAFVAGKIDVTTRKNIISWNIISVSEVNSVRSGSLSSICLQLSIAILTPCYLSLIKRNVT